MLWSHLEGTGVTKDIGPEDGKPDGLKTDGELRS